MNKDNQAPTGVKYRVLQHTKRLIGTLLKYTRAYTEKTPVFIIGCQRSGTTMLDRTFDRSKQITAYGENFIAFGEGRRLPPFGNVHYLISRSTTPIIEFKPLNDTQHIDHLLDTYQKAKAIFVYRNCLDVVNSMVEKWGDTQVRHLQQIVTDKYSGPGAAAMGERISLENRELAIHLAAQNPSSYDAAAYIWYIRNSLYFERRLDRYPNVLLCKYEEMVTKPVNYFQRIFDFIGAEFSATYVADVRTTSIDKHKPAAIKSDIMSLCESLTARLDGQCRL